MHCENDLDVAMALQLKLFVFFVLQLSIMFLLKLIHQYISKFDDHFL